MGIKAALGAAAKGYVKAARVFALVLLVSSPLIMTAFAQPAGSPSLYLTTSNANVTASTGILSCTLGAVITVEGTLIMTGNYVGPVYLQGNIDVSATYTLFDSYTGTPQTVSWSWTSGFSVNGTALDSSGFFSRTSTGTNEITFSSSQCQDVTDLPVIETWKILGYSGTIDAYDNIALGTSNLIPGYGAQLLGGTSANNPTYVLAIQLPLINDPMLGATVNATDATGNPNPVIPVGGIYNFIMMISLIIIGIGVALLLFTGLGGGGGRDKEKGGGMASVLMQVATAVIIVVVFPLVYDEVAQVINYMSQTIIAYPNPTSYFGVAIQNLWNTATAGTGVTWATVITAGIPTMAIWIMELIAWLMTYFLGIVRILLIAVMIVGFPLSVALKLIPFTSKLSRMIEDTLFGLMLAAIMSAVIAGVANQVINNFSGSFFETALGSTNVAWVAIAAIFGIILMPTVFAPLTATMMQTVSQTAMMAGGVAASVGAGVGAPAAGGVVAGGQAASAAMSKAAASGAGLGGQLSKGLSEFAGTFKSHALQPMLQNAAIVGTTGVVAAVGGSQASRAVRSMMPHTKGPGDVMGSAAAAQDAKGGVSAAEGLEESVPAAIAGVSVPLAAQMDGQAKTTMGRLVQSPTGVTQVAAALGVTGVSAESLKNADFGGKLTAKLDAQPAGAYAKLLSKIQPAFGEEMGRLNDGIGHIKKTFATTFEGMPAAGPMNRDEASRALNKFDADPSKYVHEIGQGLDAKTQATLLDNKDVVKTQMAEMLHFHQAEGLTGEDYGKFVQTLHSFDQPKLGHNLRE